MKTSALETCIAVLAVLSLLISVPLKADDGSDPVDGTINLVTGLPATDVETTPLPEGDPVYDVLWDLTHGVYLGYEPAGRYSDLVAMLAADGYVTTTTAAGIHNIDLSPYEIIVIGLGSAWNTPYTAPEVAAIQDFMSLGGGVLVMGDNADCPNANINPVTQAFGVTCGLNVILPYDLFFTDFASHEIFDGISTVHYRAAGEISAGVPGVPIAWTDAGEETIASVEYCQMIVAGDCNFCENDYLGSEDNAQLMLNVFECLASGSTPVEDSTWGTIKATYR